MHIAWSHHAFQLRRVARDVEQVLLLPFFPDTYPARYIHVCMYICTYACMFVYVHIVSTNSFIVINVYYFYFCKCLYL